MTFRYRRNAITGLPPIAREQIDRELQRIERAIQFEIPTELGPIQEKLETSEEHIASTDNPHRVTHAQLPDNGSNNHLAIDAHIASTSNPHSVTHAQLPDSGGNTHAQIDAHIGSFSNPHSVTHAQLPDSGGNTHAQIDAHIGSFSNPHQVAHAQLADAGANTHAQIDSHISDSDIHTPVPSVMPVAEAEAGVATTQRTITAEAIAAAIAALGGEFDISALAQINDALVTADELAFYDTSVGAMRKGSPDRIAEYLLESGLFLASQVEAEAGTETEGRIFSPLRVKQAIDALAPAGVTDHTALSNIGTKSHASIDAFISAFGGDWTTYTPGWEASTTNPSIGDGTLTGRWRRRGDWAEYEIFLKIGSTTSLGSGAWRFGLAAGHTIDTSKLLQTSSNSLGLAYSYDAANFNLYTEAAIQNGVSTNRVSAIGSTASGLTGSIPNAQLQPTVPIGWSQNDTLQMTFRFPVLGWSLPP